MKYLQKSLKLGGFITLILMTIVNLQAANLEKVVVGVSWDEKSIPLVQAWEDYLLAEAKENGPKHGLDFEFIVTVADLDPTRQAANIEDLIQQEADIIFARAKDGVAIGASMREARLEGIPFIAFDRKSLTDEQGVAHIGGDSYIQGRRTAEEMAKKLQAQGIEGKCIEVMGDLKDLNALARSNALNEVAKETGAFEVIIQVPTNWDPSLFLSGITTALQAKPEANCIFLASDFAWTAVKSALQSQGRWAKIGEPNHIFTATCDLFPDALKAMEEGYIDVTTTWDAYLHAKELFRVIVAVAKGEDPGCKNQESGSCLVPGRVVTKDTLGSIENIWSRDYADWQASN